MKQRELGQGGPKLSVVGLGCNNFGSRLQAEGAARVVHAALDAGVTHFDTAEMYGDGRSEEYLGAALGSHRDEVVIATKFSPRAPGEPYTPGALATRIREAVEGSLRRLGTDHIDLYYQHRPDVDAPVEEALETLDVLVRSGKVLHIASSSVSAEQISEAEMTSSTKGWTRFTGTQIEWSLLARAVEDSVVPAAQRARIGVVPFYPLASGFLTGKYRRGEAPPPGSRLASGDKFDRVATDENFDKIEALEKFAVEHDHTLTELAIAWLLAQRAVTSVIAGAMKPEQVIANVASAAWTLTPTDTAAVAAV
jgi:aryl-alcohol dehydrogenase-like predicted oxidoreductase